jgi:hypothetical protein
VKVWWHKSIILEHRRYRQEDGEFQTDLRYILSLKQPGLHREILSQPLNTFASKRAYWTKYSVELLGRAMKTLSVDRSPGYGQGLSLVVKQSLTSSQCRRKQLWEAETCCK